VCNGSHGIGRRGLTTAQIAKAFLIPESTVGPRITRAKRKPTTPASRTASQPRRTRRAADRSAVIYLLFNEGYLSSGGEQAHSRDLTDDAEFLATLLHNLMPTEPEVAGLLALIRLHRASPRLHRAEHSDVPSSPSFELVPMLL
jgi:RNA polymerase sigma-70 factor (ECF subfamily)